MLLNKLYTIGEEFFEPIEFQPGVNFIFGKKEVETDTKKSLNGIGKSALLELIDFALLSSFKKNEGKRIYDAKKAGILNGVSVVLEFTVDKEVYKIIRPFDKPSRAKFSQISSSPVEYSIEDLKSVLCDLIFKRSDYPGFYSSQWLRKLLPFYIKIQFAKDYKFTNPIKYLKGSTLPELIQYHFYLLNIDNEISHLNYEVQQELKKLGPALDEVSAILNETYNLKEIPAAENRISNLEIEIEELNRSIDAFKLKKQYKVEENKADKLTSEIKQLWFMNNNDQQKIDNYLESFNLELGFSTSKVKRLYEEFNSLLAENIKKSLDDVITFRKSLVKSRSEFLKDEIERLKGVIGEREAKIEEMDKERSSIYKFLSAQKAIKDLTSAYHSLDDLKTEMNDLKSKITTYQNLSRKKISIEKQEKNIEADLLDFKDKINRQQFEFARVLSGIYHRLYADIKVPSEFVISTNFKTDAKLTVSILESSKMLSTGRNQGRTLIYDLSVLFYSIEKGYKAPRFLIHDGIFNEMDKTHLIELYKYLNEQKADGKEFQYILTLNEEGTLTDNFGEADLLTPEKIADESIKVLTPTKLLFGVDYSV